MIKHQKKKKKKKLASKGRKSLICLEQPNQSINNDGNAIFAIDTFDYQKGVYEGKGCSS